MEQSESIAKLAVALVKAQGEFPAIHKDATNPHFKSKFASLDGIMSAVRPVLNANGLAVVQGGGEGSDDAGIVVSTQLVHVSGEWLRASIRLPLAKSDPQGAGSAVTYGKRYGLAAILGVVADEDDDGEAASRPRPKAAPVVEEVTKAQREELAGVISSPVWTDAERDSLFKRGSAMKTAKAMQGFLEKAIAEVVTRTNGGKGE